MYNVLVGEVEASCSVTGEVNDEERKRYLFQLSHAA